MIKRLHLIWLVLAAGAVSAALTLQEYTTQWVGTGSFLGKYSPKLAVVMAVVALSGLLALVGLILSLTPAWARLSAGYERAAGRLRRLGWLLPIIMGLALLAFPALLLVSPANTILLNGGYTRLWASWLLSLVVMTLAHAWKPEWDAFTVLCGALLACGLAMVLVSFRNDLSASIFTLDWSEGSRYYNASTWFSRQVYGFYLPLPELHPTRYLLQGLAFLVPGATIAFHRAWQVFLWIACNGVTAWAVARRLSPRGAALRAALLAALFGAWSFLTFFQGPIYYHLILCAFLVLWGFDRAHFWRSLVVVAVASVWAGISRINWYPVPGLMAATLYLLEEPICGRKLWRYLLPPAIWAGVGLGLAFLANAIYIPLSGNPAEVFGSALKSPLLWYRLKPNPTFGPGVLLASLVFLPEALMAAWPVLRALRKYHWIRLAGLVAALALFYVGGIFVSLKVGGGSNLHNLDNFIVFLVVIVGYIFFGKFTPDGEPAPMQAPAYTPAWGVKAAALVALILPLAAASSGLDLAPRPQPQMSETAALQWLQGMIDKYATDGRPVLFITDRQLVTFGQIKVPSFEPSYEKVFLQEMAMANNSYYLGKYVADLKARKFSLIISEPMNAHIQEDYSFAEENNLFVTNVEIPTLGRYDLVGKLDNQGYPIAVYAPKPPAQ